MNTAPSGYQLSEPTASVPIKAWIHGVDFEAATALQLQRTASMPFVHRWVAAMPDVHVGRGATVGSVVATRRAIIPAGVGVDIGCGMMAVKTSLTAEHLPDNLHGLRLAIEAAVPHGRTDKGRANDRGAWQDVPADVGQAWAQLAPRFAALAAQYPKVGRGAHVTQLGTLGTGNHFLEVCLDEAASVWLMLHSGSRGVGNRIGNHFISLAKQDMRQLGVALVDQDLAYLEEVPSILQPTWTA